MKQEEKERGEIKEEEEEGNEEENDYNNLYLWYFNLKRTMYADNPNGSKLSRKKIGYLVCFGKIEYSM